MEHFNEAGLPQPLFHRLEQMEFLKPTPIQAQAIPLAMQGHDILGTAQTGTGKTGAFGIPLVTKLLTEPKGSALVLLPTRELASQVMQALQKFLGRGKNRTALLIGGEPMPKQFSQLRQNPRLIVGTPGRINDHLKRGTLNLEHTDFLVLDEMDRMLDMGFGIQLAEIIKHLPSQRQTLMFSATLPDNIQKLSQKYLTDPVRVSVGSTRALAKNVKQEKVQITDTEKFPHLLEELKTRDGSVIIFVKTKHGADRMAERLKKQGHSADALHGDLRQNRRNKVIAAFRNKSFRVLVATDVAARGLDIPHIEHVVNYDLPQCPEDYIHRIGRTARAGAEGHSLCFITPSDRNKWNAIQRLLNPDAKIEDFPKAKVSSKKRKGNGGGSKNGGKPFRFQKKRGAEGAGGAGGEGTNRGGKKPHRGKSSAAGAGHSSGGNKNASRPAGRRQAR